MTQLFLHSDTPNEKELISIYEKAVSEAVELYIFSAYLTHWDVKISSIANCKSLNLFLDKISDCLKKRLFGKC